MDKDVKDTNSKYNRITCLNRMKIHAFQDNLITANTAHTPQSNVSLIFKTQNTVNDNTQEKTTKKR